ncbi:GNAT family N-acetyltransferase [Streptomyces sp. NPDC101191]|uniref:GNAT family N-acetyltransferase n=1 Tax=Streptomyces sp. NPDC101191 TaxID=3366126 RepID=UPI003829EB23
MTGTTATAGEAATAAAGPYEIVERSTVADVDRAEWDRLAAGSSLYSGHRWLAYLEQYRDCVPRYLLARRAGRTVGALPLYEFPGDVPKFYDPAQLLPVPQTTGATARPYVLGGTRAGYTTELLLDPGASEEEARGAARALLDRVRELRREGGLAALLYLTDETAALLLPELGPEDRLMLIDSRARIDVDADGLDGLRGRVGRKTRARIRNEMRNFEEASCVREVLPLSACHKELGPLAAQVLQRYGYPTSAEEEAARFASQAEQLDDLTQVVLARKDGRVVGFTLFFVENGTMYGRVHGLDDELARSASLYFNLTYYHAIEHAAGAGVTTLDLGCDSHETKVLRGAELQPLWGLFLDLPLDAAGRAELRARHEERIGTFAAWDPRIRTAVADRVAERLAAEPGGRAEPAVRAPSAAPAPSAEPAVRAPSAEPGAPAHDA